MRHAYLALTLLIAASLGGCLVLAGLGAGYTMFHRPVPKDFVSSVIVGNTLPAIGYSNLTCEGTYYPLIVDVQAVGTLSVTP